MKYSQEEKQKIYNAVDQIKDYIATLQPEIRKYITIDFGSMETYGYEREYAYHISVHPDEITGRSSGLGIDFTNEVKSSSTRASVYTWLEYTVALIENWPYIKKTLLDEIAKQNATIAAINNFKI